MRSSNITLSTSFGRRFRKHDTSTQRTLEQAVVDQLPDDVAAFLAAGGKIDRLPGFTEVAPLPPHKGPPPVLAPEVLPPPEDKDWRPAPGWPGYTVSRDGQVKGVRSKKIIKPRNSGKVRMYNRNAWEDVCPKGLAKLAWGSD